MSGKNELSVGGFIAIVLILLAIFSSDPSNQQSPQSLSPQSETWRNYVVSPSNGDVLEELSNSQRLIIALGNDLSRLEARNVDIQSALATANAQLANIQQQAAEDAKRQTKENWKFLILGIIGGWLANFVFPTETLGSFLSKILEKRRTKKKASSSEIIPSKREGMPENIAVSNPDRAAKEIKQTIISGLQRPCPKCQTIMALGPASQGEHKGRLVYACPKCDNVVFVR